MNTFFAPLLKASLEGDFLAQQGFADLLEEDGHPWLPVAPFLRPGSTWTKRLFYGVRWLIRRDMPEIVAIEGENFIGPMALASNRWDEEDFISRLRSRTCIGMIFEGQDKPFAAGEDVPVLGFMVYDLRHDFLHVRRVRVKNDSVHCGVYEAFIRNLKDKIERTDRRSHILIDLDLNDYVARFALARLGFSIRAYPDHDTATMIYTKG